MKTVAVHQPNFLPWSGFWNKVDAADVFVIYAGVKFDRGDYQQRVKLGGSWLTVPVPKDQHSALIKDVTIADTSALKKIARSLRQHCMSKKNPFGDRLGPVVKTLEMWPASRKSLLDLNFELLMDVRDILGIRTLFDFDLDYRELGKVENLDACLADMNFHEPFVYLSGAAAKDYMGFDSLKSPAETRFQLLSGGISADSVVQLIAQNEDPLSVIRACASWQTREGIAYAHVQPAPVGVCASLR